MFLLCCSGIFVGLFGVCVCLCGGVVWLCVFCFFFWLVVVLLLGVVVVVVWLWLVWCVFFSVWRLVGLWYGGVLWFRCLWLGVVRCVVVVLRFFQGRVGYPFLVEGVSFMAGVRVGFEGRVMGPH